MSSDVRFWRNVSIIGLAHVALIGGLIRWSRETKPAPSQSVVWMSGGAGDGGAEAVETPAEAAATPEKIETPPPEPERTATPEPEEARPVPSARSDIQLPTAEPTATATSAPRPTPTPVVKATPKPTPKPAPKVTPKAAPKAKAKPKPTATPKKTAAKATPKPSPKSKPSPEEPDEKKLAADEAKKQNAKAALEKAKAAAAAGGSGKGTSAGAGGRAGGAGGESQFGWYGSMLHDRFYSEWVQPTASLNAGSKAAALVKIRIEKDGRVSSFEIIRGSGNSILDDSVSAVAKRVTQVDPLPAGLGNGEHYDVKINFELSSDQ